jgi:hypothetical protein
MGKRDNLLWLWVIGPCFLNFFKGFVESFRVVGKDRVVGEDEVFKLMPK